MQRTLHVSAISQAIFCHGDSYFLNNIFMCNLQNVLKYYMQTLSGKAEGKSTLAINLELHNKFVRELEIQLHSFLISVLGGKN